MLTFDANTKGRPFRRETTLRVWLSTYRIPRQWTARGPPPRDPSAVWVTALPFPPAPALGGDALRAPGRQQQLALLLTSNEYPSSADSNVGYRREAG
jgi:hypothetical protein